MVNSQLLSQRRKSLTRDWVRVEEGQKVRNFFIPLVLIILSNPVWGIYKGKVFESIS